MRLFAPQYILQYCNNPAPAGTVDCVPDPLITRTSGSPLIDEKGVATYMFCFEIRLLMRWSALAARKGCGNGLKAHRSAITQMRLK